MCDVSSFSRVYQKIVTLANTQARVIELPENDTMVSHTWFETSISKLPLRFTPRLAE